MKRNIIWHELYERLEVESCPICELMNDRLHKGMDAFLYESVNDSVLRKKINESRGLCNYHAHTLADMGDPLAHALIYSDLIKDAVDSIKIPAQKIKYVFQDREKCFFCETASEGEKSYIGTFTDAYRDSMFKERYIAGNSCVCLPHLEQIKYFRRGRLDISSVIVEDTLQKYSGILHDLSEIRRKNDYRYVQEPWTEQQKKAWKKAVVMLAAQKGIRK